MIPLTFLYRRMARQPILKSGSSPLREMRQSDKPLLAVVGFSPLKRRNDMRRELLWRIGATI
jgi:hypothetical protein